jgi:hypothetical protein
MYYKIFLPKLHEILRPARYVEIGIRHGYSLSLAPTAQKVAIDPSYGEAEMEFDVGPVKFFKMTSDDFFAKHDLNSELGQPFDLAYIDGLHLFEFALRDFMNLEKASTSGSVIIVDDVLPRNEGEAQRRATGGAWTGDVWKIIPCLMKYRPDLAQRMILARSDPTGCLIIPNPDRNSTVLKDNYDAILKTYLDEAYPVMPDASILAKSVSAADALIQLKAAVSAK